MSTLDTSGWAIRRNNSCYTSVGENFCQNTIYTFKACCPPSSFCPTNYTHNAYCCSTMTDCLQALINNGPYCANETWTPYVASDGGPFCCDPSEQGFAMGTTDGCAPAGYVLGSGERYLNPVRAVAKPTNSSSATPSASTSAQSSSSSGGSGVVVGAIVGGIVGGVGGLIILAFIAWRLVRRHDKRERQKEAEQGRSEAAPSTIGGKTFSDGDDMTITSAGDDVPPRLPYPIEVGGTPRAELEGWTKTG